MPDRSEPGRQGATRPRRRDPTRHLVGAASAALIAAAPALAQEEGGARIGLISTPSGGGAGLGLDTRDGFMLAIERSGRDDVEVIVEDDQQKPDMAVRIADATIQSDAVDIVTGIISSNLAMAVVPSASAQGVFYVSPNEPVLIFAFAFVVVVVIVISGIGSIRGAFSARSAAPSSARCSWGSPTRCAGSRCPTSSRAPLGRPPRWRAPWPPPS